MSGKTSDTSWKPSDWDDFKDKHTEGKTAERIFTARGMSEDMDPAKIKGGVRESRDSVASPNSNSIILGLDVTGSMNDVVEAAIKGLGTLVTEIHARKPVSDPQILVAGIGDVAAGDNAPLQVSQFEIDIRIAEQLKNIWLEGRGGSNPCESYNLPWYFAAMKTEIDCFEKRGKKGLLFTFGDEECPEVLTRGEIKKVFGDTVQSDISTKDLLNLVRQKYDVFHVVVEQGNGARRDPSGLCKKWTKIFGQGYVIPLSDINKLSEVVVSVMEVHAGKDKAEVEKSWDGKTTALVVRRAVADMKQELEKADGPGVVWRPAAGGRGGK